MKRIMGFLFWGMIISGSASSQTTKDKIDKAFKDPKRSENAARADAQLINKMVISDTSVTVMNQNVAPQKQEKKKSKKKNNGQ